MSKPTTTKSGFYQQQLLQRSVANDHTKSLSTLETLSALKLLKDVTPEDGKEVIDAVIQEETRYLSMAMRLLSADNALSQRFGRDLQGSMAVSGLIKQRYAEKRYNALIDRAIPAEAIEKGFQAFSEE